MSNMFIIAAHRHAHKMVVLLCENNWSKATQEMWRTTAVKRLYDLLQDHAAHTDVCQYVLEQNIQRLCADLEKLKSLTPQSGATHHTREQAIHLREKLRHALIPTVFVHGCTREINKMLSYVQHSSHNTPT